MFVLSPCITLALLCVLRVEFILAGDPNRFDGDPLLRQYLQPNHVTNGAYDSLSTQEAEARGICTRPCDGATPMICYYHFTLESYTTVGPACGNCTLGTPKDCNNKQCVVADGFERQVLTINRQIPAPSIQVCLYDTIVVDVHNKMLGRTVTLHWHGLYQRYTPYMDGVQFVTQCPILHNTKFRYKFPAVPDGTFFFHSHIAVQKMDGLEGSLIIREPRSIDKSTARWDFDLPSHVMIVTDWLHGMTDERFPGFVRTADKTSIYPVSYLINGKNNYASGNGTQANAPYHQFNVKRGFRYRFRIIAGSCLSCPYVISIEQHKLLLIATDGTYAEPDLYDSITMVAGDRMDVVVNATAGNAGDSFWINVRAACPAPANNTIIHGEAILHYAEDGNVNTQAVPSSPRPNGDTPRGKSLNAGDQSNCVSADDDLVCMSHVNALDTPVNPVVLKSVPDFRLFVSIGFHTFSRDALFWNDYDQYHKWAYVGFSLSAIMNNRSFEHPPFPLLTQIDKIPPELVCPESCVDRANSTYLCECVHLVKYPLGSVGEMIFLDQMTPDGIFYHPMHLHGNDMYIIEQGKIPSNYSGNLNGFIAATAARLDVLGPQLMTVRSRPVVKDTIGNIPNGYTVVRVHFNNPGFWFFHCHFIYHTALGMDMVIQIGERYMMRNPPAFFPRCNNYLPPVYPDEFTEFMQGEMVKRTLGLDNQ